MSILPYSRAILLLLGLACASCQSGNPDASIAADLNSTNPAVAAQAQKVQQLVGQIKQQEAVIDADKQKLKGVAATAGWGERKPGRG